ncbi:MAG: GntR family transcriptional regulator [Planctomycetaceae bacterium]|nr:GntR family transcriptional regulator [Planctomycetaceae bacterium]
MTPPKPNLEPVERLDRPVPLVLLVEQALRRAITEQTFPDGKLPTEVELAEGFGVSRETVRRAAEVLQREGLLRKYRRRGTVVESARPTIRWPQRETSKLIGFVVANYRTGNAGDDVATGTDGAMLQGAVDCAGESQFEVIVRSAAPAKMRECFEQLVGNHALRGAILASVAEEKPLKKLGGRALPLVLLDHDLHVPKTPSIRDDSALGSRLAVEHLVALGHRQIAYVHWQQADLNPWRLRGYREGLTEAGVRRRKNYELFASISEAGGQATAEALLALKPRPTAVVCFNNTLARWLIVALRALSMQVPRDVSVVGCGGEAIFDLTTCQVDWYQMGRQAMRMLLDQVDDPTRQNQHIRVAPVLSLGTTTAPP